MTKKTLLPIIKLTFILVLCVLVYVHKQSKPRIIIIHSYDSSYSWVNEINAGVNRFYDQLSCGTTWI